MKDSSRFETFKAQGNQVVDLVKQLINEGNVRRIVIRQGDRTVLDLPLTFGVLGAVIAPALAVVAAGATLLTDCTVHVERSDGQETDGHSQTSVTEIRPRSSSEASEATSTPGGGTD